MAEYATTTETSVPSSNAVVFHGSPRNMAVGFAMIFAGALAFVMGMTNVFFAEALAWTFVIWGALFLLFDLVDYLETWTVSDEGLEIKSPMRFWASAISWKWENINRLEVKVKRNDPDAKDLWMTVSHQLPGEIVLEREERIFSPQLANLIVQHTGIKPAHAEPETNFETLKVGKGLYTWNKTGKLAS